MIVHRPVPPEAELIRRHREAATPALSRRQAAAKAGISPSQWGDVERGRKRAGSDIVVPVQATTDTLARMARAVGVSPDDLAAAGRQDAADKLRDHDQRHDLRRRLAAIRGLGAADLPDLTSPDGQELLPLIAAGLDAIERTDLSATARRDLATMFTNGLIHDATRRHSELLLILRLATTAAAQSG